jgi:hypothetical protein
MSESFASFSGGGGRKKPGNEANNDEMETEKAHFSPHKRQDGKFFFLSSLAR